MRRDECCRCSRSTFAQLWRIFDLTDTTVILTSDHGNIEDLSSAQSHFESRADHRLGTQPASNCFTDFHVSRHHARHRRNSDDQLSTMDSSAKQTVPVARYSYYALGVLTLVNFLNYINRQVLPAVAPIMQRDLGLSDTEIGAMEASLLL